MNEVELIRAQLALERQHAAAVSHALSAAAAQEVGRHEALEAFREASVSYLARTLSCFEEREQIFRDLVRARFNADDPKRHVLETAFALRGTNREALAKLEAALRPESGGHSQSDSANAIDSNSGSQSRESPNENQAARWADFLLFFDGAWSARRSVLDKLFAQHAKVTDWRAVSGIDADSIFDERHRYARVHATRPEGIELAAMTAHV
jgi:hypothetical protein